MKVLLTQKEQDIVNLIVKFNHSNREIAERLDMPLCTVEVYINMIYRASNMSVPSHYKRTELVRGIRDGDIVIVDKPLS